MDGAQARIFSKSAIGGQSGAGGASRSSQNSKSSALNPTSSASAAHRSDRFEGSSSSNNVNNGTRTESNSVNKQPSSAAPGTNSKGGSVNSSTSNQQQQQQQQQSSNSSSLKSSSNVVHNNSSNNLSSSINGAQSITAPNKRPNQSSSGNNNGSNDNTNSSSNTNSRNTTGRDTADYGGSRGGGGGRTSNKTEYGETGSYSNNSSRPSNNKQRDRDDGSGYYVGSGREEGGNSRRGGDVSGYGDSSKNDSYYYRENSRRTGGGATASASTRSKTSGQQQQPVNKQRQSQQEYYDDEEYEYDEADYYSHQQYRGSGRGGAARRGANTTASSRNANYYDEKEQPARRISAGQNERRTDASAGGQRDERAGRVAGGGGARREQTSTAVPRVGKNDEKGWGDEQDSGQSPGQWETSAGGNRSKTGSVKHAPVSQQPSTSSPSVNSASATPAIGSGDVSDDLPSSGINGGVSGGGNIGRAPSRDQQGNTGGGVALNTASGESTWPSVSQWSSPSNATSNVKDEPEFGGVWDASGKIGGTSKFTGNVSSSTASSSAASTMKLKDAYGDLLVGGHRSGSNPSANNISNDSSGNDNNNELGSGSAGGGSNRRSVPLGVGSASDSDYLGTSRWGNPSSNLVSSPSAAAASSNSSNRQGRNNEGSVNSGGSFVGMWTNSTVAGGGATGMQNSHAHNWENLTKFTKQDSGSTDNGRGSASASTKPTPGDNNPHSPLVANNSMFTTSALAGGANPTAVGPQPLVNSITQHHLDVIQQFNKIQAAAAAAAVAGGGAPGVLPLPRPEIGGVPGLHNTNRPHMMAQTTMGGSMQSPAASFINSFNFPGSSTTVGGGGLGGLGGGSGPLPVPGARWQPPPPFGAPNASMGVSPGSNQALEIFSQLNAETAKLAAAAVAAGNLQQQQQQQQQQHQHQHQQQSNAALLGMQSHLAHQQQQHPGGQQMMPPHLQQQQSGHQQSHGPSQQPPLPPPPFNQQMFLNQLHQQQVQQAQQQQQQQQMEHQKLILQQQQANEELRKQQQQQELLQRQREEDERRAAAEAAARAAAAQAEAEAAAAAKRKQQEDEEAALNRADEEYEAELRSMDWDEQFGPLKSSMSAAGQNDYSACKKRMNELHAKFQSSLQEMIAAPSRDELKRLIAVTRFMLETGEQCFLRDAVRSYAEGLHDIVWKHGLHALISFMRREHDVAGGSNAGAEPKADNSQRIHERRGLRAALDVLLEFGIDFLQQLVSRVLGLFGGRVDALALQLASNLTNSQEKVLKLAAHLDIALGDLYRYKGVLIGVSLSPAIGDGGAVNDRQRNKIRLQQRDAFRRARICYEDAYNLCATDGYPQNQLALVSRLERCYLDMVYHCVRALSVPKQPFLLSQHMLSDTLREIGSTYENSLDKKLSSGSIDELDLPTLMRECNLLFLYFHALIGSSLNAGNSESHAAAITTTPRTTPNSKQPSSTAGDKSSSGLSKKQPEPTERQQQQYQQIIFDFLTRWKAVLARGICEPVRNVFLKMNVVNMYVLSNAIGNPAVFPPVIDLCLHMFAALVERLLDVLNEASSTQPVSAAVTSTTATTSAGSATLSGSSGGSSSNIMASGGGNAVEHQLESVIMDQQVALLMSCCKAFCDWLVTHIAAWNPLPAIPFLQSAEWTYERMLTLLAELCTVSRQINLQGVNELVPYRTERVVPFQLVEDSFARNMSSIREAHVIFHNEPSLTREVAEMRARMSRFMLLGNMFATMQNPVFEFDVQTLDLRPVPKYIDKSLEGKYRRLRLVQPAPSLHLSVALQAAAAAAAAGQPAPTVTPNPAVMNFFNSVLPPPPPQAALSTLTAQQQHEVFAASPAAAAAAMYAAASGGGNAAAAANAVPFGAPRWNAHRTLSSGGARAPQGLVAPPVHAPPPPPPASAKVEDWPDLMDADIAATQYPPAVSSAAGRRKGDSESSAGGMQQYVRGNGSQQNNNIPSPSSTPGLGGGSMDFEQHPPTATPPVTPSTSTPTTPAASNVKSSISQPWWLIDKNMRREAMRMVGGEGGVKRDNMLSGRTDSTKSNGDTANGDQPAAATQNNQRKYLFVDTNALLKGGGDSVKKLMTEESRMAVMVPSVVVRELTNHAKDLSRSHEEQSDAHAALDFIFELSMKRDSRVKIISIGGLLLKDSSAAMKENAWERGSNDDLILKCVKNAVEKGFIATELKNASTVVAGGGASAASPQQRPLVAFLTEDTNLRTKARRELIEARSLQDVADAKFKWV